MSIIISGIKLDFEENEEQAVKSALKILNTDKRNVVSTEIYKQSLDLRKGQVKKVFSVVADLCTDEKKLVKRLNRNDVRLTAEIASPKILGDKRLESRPVIVGFGPAGMFAGLILAQNGYAPIILERGGSVEERDAVTEEFFSTGRLIEDTNVQFGEGGAGTYSDGKLTTRIHDERARLVLKYLLEHGAPKEVGISAKPHIGTDLLKGIVVSIRKEIIKAGGEVRFNERAESITAKDGRVCSVITSKEEIKTDILILAIGHSARDTYRQLYKSQIELAPKGFAVGVRVEHRQSMINDSLYGQMLEKYRLPQGEYALANTENGRGCYTFCMCPGGKVIACASEMGGTVTNGMSCHARDGENANSAVVVTVSPKDFNGNDVFGGIDFQRELECKAFNCGNGDFKAPIQLFKDFESGTVSCGIGSVKPTYNRGTVFADINNILPCFVTEEIKKSMRVFGRKIKGFDSDDCVLTGVETRTSSPLRIVRNELTESVSTKGLYPCGEGAGYAGGIMSAAVDGIKVAERIMAEFTPLRG